MSIQELKNRNYFSTSDITRLGVDKKAIKKDNNFVCLGTFPTRGNSGENILQKIYTYSPDLADLVKLANKKMRKPTSTEEERRYFVKMIDEKVKEVFGWDQAEEQNGGTEKTKKENNS